MQPKEDIEKSYETPDPWGYQTNPEDKKRYMAIMGLIRTQGIFWARAIDICCGEGWITSRLPAKVIHGIEISDNAAARFPQSMTRVHKPDGKYELILSTGCLYAHYDWKAIVGHIREAATRGSVIVISNIESWELKEAVAMIPGKQFLEARYPYNEHYQKARVFVC